MIASLILGGLSLAIWTYLVVARGLFWLGGEAFQVAGGAGGAGQDAHLHPRLDQGERHRRTDKAGRAGDEDALANLHR